MSFEVNITFCVILSLWTSTSAQIYSVQGKWEAKVEKCRNNGDENQIHNYKINNSTINNLTYKFFTFDTTVKVGGIIELETGFTDPVKYTEWALYEFDLINNVKYYTGELRIEGSDNAFTNQVAYWKFTLSVQSNDSIEIQNKIYAGSWGSFYCASVKSSIHSLTIAR